MTSKSLADDGKIPCKQKDNIGTQLERGDRMYRLYAVDESALNLVDQIHMIHDIGKSEIICRAVGVYARTLSAFGQDFIVRIAECRDPAELRDYFVKDAFEKPTQEPDEGTETAQDISENEGPSKPAERPKKEESP